MHHVFISYSRTDADWVNRLAQRLETAGNPIWLDQRDIPMTLPWFEQIGDAIAAADVFLICDSPASRESANCGAETRLAFEAEKPTVEVTVGEDLTAAAGGVTRARAGLHPSHRARTELAVLARDWDRGGRERSALISARERRRLSGQIVAQPRVGSLEQAFLKASRRRARRRKTISALILAVVGLSILAAFGVDAAVEQYEEANDRLGAAYSHTNRALREIAEDPYAGLAEAAALGQNESATDAEVITGALGIPVPVAAFRVSAGDGLEKGEEDPPPGWRLETRPDSSVVDVFREDVLWRRVAFSQPPRALALSPDGRELAAAAGSFAEIADLRLGRVRTELSGAVGPIRNLAWSTDGARLWALGRGLAVSWDARDGEVLLNLPEERFEALLPSGEGMAWVVGESGLLRRFDVDSGRVLATLRVPDEVNSGGGAPDGSVAALSGERGLWIVPLDGAAPRLVPMGECSLGRPVFADPATFYLPCIGGDLLRMSARTAEIERRIRVSPIGVFAVRPLPRSDVLLASDTLSGLFAVRADGKGKEIFRGGCGGSITRIAVDSGGRVVAPVGSGTGFAGCLRRGVLDGEDPGDPSAWTFDALNDPSRSALAEAAAVSAGGDVFAYGYSDGTVILHPTVNILPALTVTNVIGEIRDMYASGDDQLLVATAGGILQRLPLCGRCLSNRSLAKLARARLQRGLKLGTALRKRNDGFR